MLGQLSLIPSSGAPFNPTNISGLTLWLKADTLGLNDNDAVTSWSDSSGNGFNVSQANGTQQPIFKTNIKNALPIVRFDGSNDVLATSTSLALAQPLTVCFVAFYNSGGTFQDTVNGTVPSATLHNNSNFALYAGGLVEGSSSVISAFHIFTGIYNGASSTGFVDGASYLSGDVGSNSWSTTYIGNNNAGSSGINGDIGEVIIYNSALSSTDRTKVETYLNNRWAIF